MLRVSNVSKRYGRTDDGYLALDGIDLEIADCEFLCLLGSSGCGKSTLLNILAGFESATRGDVMLHGVSVHGAGQDRVLCFQDAGSALFPWLTVAENVAFGLRTRGMPRHKREPLVTQYLEMVRLVPHAAK